MRCSKARRLISDYIDGTLKTKNQLPLERHLETCQDCELFLADFQAIQEGARKLEAPSPSEKVWSQILSKLGEVKQEVKAPQPKKREWLDFLFYSPKVRYALATVGVLVVIVAGMRWGLKKWQGEEILAREKLEKVSLAKLEEAERHCQRAIKALNEAISAQKGSLDPQVAEVFAINLKALDSSIDACRQAILEEPDNLKARGVLLAAYWEKIDFLNEIVEVKRQPSPKRGQETTL